MVPPAFRQDAQQDDDDDDWEKYMSAEDNDHNKNSSPTPTIQFVNPLIQTNMPFTGLPDGFLTRPGPRPSGPPRSYESGLPPWMQSLTTGGVAQPEHEYTSTRVTPLESVSTTSLEEDPGPTDDSSAFADEGNHRGILWAAGIAVPLAVIAIVAIIALLWLRKRKRNKKNAIAQSQMQMKDRSSQVVAAHYSNSNSNLPASPSAGQPQYPAPSAQPPYSPSSPSVPPPVILGPIVPGSNGAYFTGIDTSDIVSMNERPNAIVNDRTGLGDPFADNNSVTDEPPPPYRPRSIATISRDSSLRAPPPPPAADHSRTNLLDPRHQGSNQPERSPFADPEDDAVSVLSGQGLRRNPDSMSVVSDMSYQQDPVVTRPTV